MPGNSMIPNFDMDRIGVPAAGDAGFDLHGRHILAILGVLTLVVYIYGLRIVQRFEYRQYPGPKPAWMIGSIKESLKRGQHIVFQEYAKQYGAKLHVVHMAATPQICVPDPEMARRALIAGPRPDISQDSVMPLDIRNRVCDSLLLASFGGGLTAYFVDRGQLRHDLKAAWLPVFFTGSLENYMGIMDRGAKSLVKEMSWAVQKGSLNMSQPIQDMTLNVIGHSAFGVDLHTQQADEPELDPSERERSDRLRVAAKKFFVNFNLSIWVICAKLAPIMLPVIRFLACRFPDKVLAQLIASRLEIEEALAALVDEHKEKIGQDQHNLVGECHRSDSAGNRSVPGGHKTSAKKGVAPGSFIDLLLKKGKTEAGQKFSQQLIVQQAMTMLLTGYETTANTLIFTTFLLSQSCHAEKQAKIVKEIDELGPDWVPAYEDLEEKLPYTDAVLHETLRLFPPAFNLWRQTEEPIEFEGHKVKKDSWFTVPVYGIQRDPEFWGPDANAFSPERWLIEDPEAIKAMKRSFFAYGAGPRSCPASRFAKFEMKLALIRIFQAFTLELLPDQEPIATRDSFILAPKNGAVVRPMPRAAAA